MESCDWRKRTVLPDERIGSGFEMFPGILRPPIANPPLAIKVCSLIVVAMPHLVTNDGANGTEIDRWIGMGIKKRRLQKRGGKFDGIGQDAKARIDDLWRLVPNLCVLPLL